MSVSSWRVTAFGVGGTEYTYVIEAGDREQAQEEAYGRHGRRLRDGEVNEPLGTRSFAVPLGEEDSGEK